MFILLRGRSNKTLYGDVSLIPLPGDYQPSVQKLPGTGTGLDKGNAKVVTRLDTPKYGETLKFVYIKYQPILAKSCQRFTKFNYGVTRTIYES